MVLTVKTRRRALAVGVVTLALALPTAANAVSVLYSWSGSDYSYNSSTGRTIYACDNEADGHVVRADYVRNGSTTVVSVTATGGSGTCEEAYGSATLYRHRVVEVIPAQVDDYGAWKYPS